MRPGQRTIIGTRMPPSYRSRLMPGNGPELPFAFVPPEKFRIIIVRVHLIEVTEPLIESVAIRHPGGSFVAQSPLADYGGAVSRRFQDFGDGQVVELERHLGVAANPGMAG